MYALFEKGKNKPIGIYVLASEDTYVTAYVFQYKKDIISATVGGLDIEDCEEIRKVDIYTVRPSKERRSSRSVC